jgi:two-component system sensor histidine kinase TctE
MGARRLERLIAQLLALARADEQAPAAANRVVIDLVAVTASVAADRAPQAIAAGQDLSFEAPEEAVSITVSGTEFMIAEIVGNILDNAIRYNRPGGRVVIRVAADDPPSVTIEDEGLGIPESHRELVFDRFYRLAPQASEGTGLGLAIVRTIADRLGASVRLSDRAEGPGLAVTIMFPRGQRETRSRGPSER